MNYPLIAAVMAERSKARLRHLRDRWFEAFPGQSFCLKIKVKMSKYFKSMKLLYQTRKYRTIFHRFEAQIREITIPNTKI